MTRPATMRTDIASGHTAVMAQRREPPDSLDFFPTPPWATRALLTHVIPDAKGSCWEPACGEGHMVAPLCEQFETVYASDVHDYGGRQWVGSFVGSGPDVIHERFSDPVDWVVTNPPFNLGVEFALRALDVAAKGVALLLRSVWLESRERYEAIFSQQPPTTVAVFCERVPMTKGRWNPEASTATSYAWFVWRITGDARKPTELVWIPPGQRSLLERSDDRARFARRDA